MGKSSIKIREAIISGVVASDIVDQIDAVVAGVPGATNATLAVPLRSITLADLQDAKAAHQEPRSERPSDTEILAAITALGGDTDAQDVSGIRYVRATKIAARLGVSTSTIRRRLQSLARAEQLVTVGKAAGKRYAVKP